MRKRARKQGVKVSTSIAGGLTVITLILGAISSGHLFHNADIEDLKKKQEIVEYDVKNHVDIERKLEDLDNRLKELERTMSSATLQEKKAQGQGKAATTLPGKHL